MCYKFIPDKSGHVLEFERILVNQAFLEVFGDVLSRITYNEGILDDLDLFMLLSKVWTNEESEDLVHRFSGFTVDYRVEIRKLDNSVLVTTFLPTDQKTEMEDNVKLSQRVEPSPVFLEDEGIRKLSRAVEQSPVSIVITDTNGFIEYVNPVFFELTGYTRDEVMGKNPKILKSGMVPREDYEDLWETILSGHIWKGEFINKKKNGDLYFESATIAPVLDANEQITHFVAVKQDVTKNKKYEQDLIDAREKARESDILKAAFLQNMSHEIRTPMNAIQGFSELAKMPGTSSQKRNSYLDIVIQSTHRLLGIVDDIIDISKLETGDIVFKSSPVRLQGFMLGLHKSFADKTGNQVVLEKPVIDPALQKATVSLDSSRLRQVLEKLLSNAVKFTKQGFIKFGCHQIGGSLRFFVEDTGIGIPPDAHDLIFQPFYQLDMGATRAFGGNGLGLTIAARIIDKMGSSIKVDSQQGKGSVFYFDIWTEKSESYFGFEDIINLNLHEERNHYNLLLVVNDEMDFILMKELLGREFGKKLKILKASSSYQAIEICREQKMIDLVLLDMKLLNFDGISVARQIKSIFPHVPVIARTTSLEACERKQIEEAGCNDFINKSIQRDSFISLIYKYLKTAM